MKKATTKALKKRLFQLLFPSFKKDYQSLECIAENRLNRLKHLIYLSYLYESRKDIFFRKFRESVRLEELKKKSIVTFTYDPKQIADFILQKNLLADKANISYDPTKISKNILTKHIDDFLSAKDREILTLMACGFLEKELHVILEMKNPASIHVKLHRIRKKCLGESLPSSSTTGKRSIRRIFLSSYENVEKKRPKDSFFPLITMKNYKYLKIKILHPP